MIAFVYTISNFLPARIRTKLSDAVKSELSQIILSAVIIVLLIGASQVVCSLSASYTSSLVPGAQAGLNPFQYADYYIGNLATIKGVSLLTEIYSYSIAYQVDAQIVYQALDFLSGFASGVGATQASGLFAAGGLSIVGSGSKSDLFSVSLVLPAVEALTSVYTSLSATYMVVFSPLITLSTGALILQYLLLAVMQYTAFTTILPAAIIMRSLAFTGTNLKNSANALLAIAIALYLIYPLTIALDYITRSMMHYALQYSGQTYQLQNVQINSFFSSFGGTGGTTGASLSIAQSLMNSVSSYVVWPWDIMNTTQNLINLMAQYIFQAIVLFAINIAITIGFATGLAKALNSGIEGVGSFWNSI